MTCNQHNAACLAMMFLLVTLCGCGASVPPYDNAYEKPPPWQPRTISLKETASERSAVSRAVEWISRQQYQAALDLLEPLHQPPADTETDAPADTDPHQQAEVLFWTAYCYEKQGRPDEAQPLYQHVRDHFRHTRFAPIAQARLEVLKLR